ncbi:hypothetical protein [Streptomyces sp. F001]|uniref:hypothetical protein n=1 Tax=Streptomyces sp. F001 TaxID=1510026 RepID=UPI0019D2D427|nr:hypothetical protein [Streptomyces sp. F001]
MPLLRLGRLDEHAPTICALPARTAMESMRGAYADHVEFCTLTGNEARGLSCWRRPRTSPTPDIRAAEWSS